MSVSIADRAKCVRAGFIVDRHDGGACWHLIYNPRSTTATVAVAQSLETYPKADDAWQAAFDALQTFPPHLKGE